MWERPQPIATGKHGGAHAAPEAHTDGSVPRRTDRGSTVSVRCLIRSLFIASTNESSRTCAERTGASAGGGERGQAGQERRHAHVMFPCDGPGEGRRRSWRSWRWKGVCRQVPHVEEQRADEATADGLRHPQACAGRLGRGRWARLRPQAPRGAPGGAAGASAPLRQPGRQSDLC